MGCWSSKPPREGEPKKSKQKEQGLKRPKWASDKALDGSDLEPSTIPHRVGWIGWTEKAKYVQRMRAEFWDTQPAYGGAKEVWDALKAVAEDLNNPNNKLILESAGISYQNNDLRTTYDEKGFKYDLPNFVLSEPTNLVKSGGGKTTTTHHSDLAQEDG